MILSIPLLLLSGVVLLFTRKSHHWGLTIAAVIFGFALATSPFAPTINQGIHSVQSAISGMPLR